MHMVWSVDWTIILEVGFHFEPKYLTASEVLRRRKVVSPEDKAMNDYMLKMRDEWLARVLQDVFVKRNPDPS